MQFITPEPRDVLCGRGISCHQHPGNKLLRQLIDRNLPKYATADSKSDKSSILRDIIRSILQQGGRFLKKDSETEFYYEAGMKAARYVTLRSILRELKNSTWNELYMVVHTCYAVHEHIHLVTRSPLFLLDIYSSLTLFYQLTTINHQPQWQGRPLPKGGHVGEVRKGQARTE